MAAPLPSCNSNNALFVTSHQHFLTTYHPSASTLRITLAPSTRTTMHKVWVPFRCWSFGLHQEANSSQDASETCMCESRLNFISRSSQSTPRSKLQTLAGLTPSSSLRRSGSGPIREREVYHKCGYEMEDAWAAERRR